jgi:transcription antitermination factor NusG
MMSWLVATFRRHRVAEENLQAQGFATFFPFFLEKRASRGRISTTRQHLFGSYFFVGEASVDDAAVINNTRGVARVIGSISRGEVEDIRGRETEVEEDLEPGQKVRVVCGAFVSHIGIFQGMSRSNRESVFLEMWNGTKLRVELPAGSLIAA